MMYVAKVYLNKRLNNVKFYDSYEHFISDLIDSESVLYEDLPEELNFTKIEACHPRICSCCQDDLGFSTDFEYRYENGLLVYCGEIMTEESAREAHQV